MTNNYSKSKRIYTISTGLFFSFFFVCLLVFSNCNPAVSDKADDDDTTKPIPPRTNPPETTRSSDKLSDTTLYQKKDTVVK